MNAALRARLKRTTAYSAFARLRYDRRSARIAAEWRLAGCRLPAPSEVKRQVLVAHATTHRLRVFVETGTFVGDTTDHLRLYADRVITIEVDQALHEAAVRRFAFTQAVEVVRGDSGELLPGLLRTIDERCLFWLDGHYSGGITGRGALDTPILAELRAIVEHPVRGHVILVDDARCFTGSDGYPSLEEMVAFGEERGYVVTNEHDIIRMLPQ